MSHSSDPGNNPHLTGPLSPLQAIPTYYGGVWHRSRLEARWAVFFTRIGHDNWRWEPQRYRGKPKSYLPDFYLPRLHLWVEIKPTMVDQYDGPALLAAFNLWQDFANKVKAPDRAAMFIGDIPNPDAVGVRGPLNSGTWLDAPTIVTTDEYGYAWCSCPKGLHFDIALGGDGNRIDCPCPRSSDEWPFPTGDDPHILNAYAAARSERFEYGRGR